MPDKHKINPAIADTGAEFLFHQGTNYRAYDYLGARTEGDEFVFRVWAPNATKVYVTGDFNGWGKTHPLARLTVGGIWGGRFSKQEMTASFGQGARYKYIIERNSRDIYKSDPYAFYSETNSKNSSLFYDIEGYRWQDDGYLEERKALSKYLLNDKAPPKPVNIYEVHLGSWKRHSDGSYYTYKELADELSEYVKAMGYTHVEIMPVSEHPFDGSWGYQVCGYYSPTSRFGTPKDFMAFIDTFHQKGIGVILDWVPSHFPKDEHGLFEFDGSPLYEYQGQDRMEHKDWGTRAFDVGRNEVRCFLISNAAFWLEKYHADGLRVDAVASMLYLDYGRKPGEWNPNPDGTNINYQSVAFFKDLNAYIKSKFPDTLMIAEESTSYVGVTRKHGLGFNLKWNMGWMNDTLNYIQTDSYFRAGIHNTMSFASTYAFDENFVLPISHDEVVHGKKSLIDKMFGDYAQKFDCMKTYLGWMYSHPGKKLLFMGCEFAQFREWDYASQLEWFMLDYPAHRDMKEYVKALNHFYLENSELWEIDGESEGFNWLDADRKSDNVYLFERINAAGKKLVCVFNFSPVHREVYTVPVTKPGWYREVFSSKPSNNKKAVRAKKKGNRYEISIQLPPLTVCFFKNTKDI
ncbi:MAG: 1,4-alpha-glucan branching protein GlgB [Eubacteriales bacterium]|jgi:1,4-alpha-glucan branching enzyme